jgi:3-dehydroquinate synthase
MSESFRPQVIATEARQLTITASTGSYSVSIESHAFARFLSTFDQPVVLADEFFRDTISSVTSSAIFLPALETNKSLDASPALIEQLRKSGVNRQTHLVAVGGGILQDLSAFIASIYMRGLSWSYLPTTILAMVDSCIGGKSSINVGPYKNLVGTFHPPQRILIDPSLAQALPIEQRASGLIEAAKICFCRGEESFEKHLSFGPSPAMSTESLEKVVVNSLTAKKWFIEVDEFDKGERLLLNFGHTFGHAIEGASHYAIPHGIAVGLGILCAMNFQRQRGVVSNAPRTAQLEAHLALMVRALPELDRHLQSLSFDEVLERMASDKKHTTTHYTLILVASTGEVVLDRVPRTSETDAQIIRAIQSTLDATIDTTTAATERTIS